MFVVRNHACIPGLRPESWDARILANACNDGLCSYTVLWESGMAARDSGLCS